MRGAAALASQCRFGLVLFGRGEAVEGVEALLKLHRAPVEAAEDFPVDGNVIAAVRADD